ncbi:hypothetical protein XENTR_v10018055 [Xenopus tropicalis]|nr:hypothetical protein XENTR_v10018055 [Xenopus tropicalis]
MEINSSNVNEYAQQLVLYTGGASAFADKMDVLYVAEMMEKLILFTDHTNQLSDAVIEIASNMMLVDDQILSMAQNEAKACSRIVQCVEIISLNNKAQAVSKVSLNIALEAVIIKPANFLGMTCIAYQKTSSNSVRPPIHGNGILDAENTRNQNLIVKCNNGNISGSLLHFSAKLT